MTEPDARMKVLFVLPRMVSGGVERVTLNLIAQFVKDGIECRIALRHCRGELLAEARALVPVHEVAALGIYQFVPNLAKLIRQWRPTRVITAFSDIAILTWVAMRVAKSRAKWVHGVHNTHALVAARPGIIGHLRHRLDNRLAKMVYLRADKIVAVSNGVRSEVIGRFDIDPSRVIRIYNPVVPEDQLVPRPNAPHIRARPFRIVAIGRLAWQKGFDLLIEALSRVSSPWELHIYGDGPQRGRLDRMIHAHGLRSVVHLRGFCADPFEVLRAADLFVLASRYEGLANVVIEALACQCQIVSTDCPQGPREILQGGRLGQLVPVEDPGALANAIERAMAYKSYVASELLLDRAGAFSINASALPWKRLLRECGDYYE